QAGLEAARAALAAANDARAVAVWEARRSGVTLRRLGVLLGMAHKNVLELERRGAEVVASGRPVAPVVVAPLPDPVAPVVAPDTTPESPRPAAPVVRLVVAGAACLREGCPLPAAEGVRFCRAHQWN